MAIAKCKCTDHAADARWHGSVSGHQYHGCRCDRCVEGYQAYYRAYRVGGERVLAADGTITWTGGRVRLCGCGEPLQPHRTYCPGCARSRMLEGYAQRDLERKEQLRERRRRLLGAQGGVCALCRLPLKLAEATIDHDHACCAGPAKRSCGECDRAVLHRLCNGMLGQARDTPELLEQGARFLRQVPLATQGLR